MKAKWRYEKTKKDRERLYRSLIPVLREVARKSGYALGVHGSLRRDLDLIAVPWIRKAVRPATLADRLSIAACGLRHNGGQKWETKPHGRRATAIYIGMHVYIDLSVVPFHSKK